MAYDFKNIAKAGLNRSKRTLKSLDNLGADLKKEKAKKKDLDDLGYYLMLKAENRQMHQDKYDEIVKDPFVINNFKDIPSFSDVYSGKSKFSKGGVDYSFSDLNNLITVNKIQSGDIKFDMKFGNSTESKRYPRSGTVKKGDY